MCSTKVLFVLPLFSVVFPALSQSPEPHGNDAFITVPLNVDAGVPLRVYLTKRLTKRLGETVHARLIEPVFAFDREVIPANSEVIGKVVRLDRVSKMRRATAIAGGDFTPLHDAAVEFTTVVFPDGRRLTLHTAATMGLNSIYSPRVAAVKKKQAAAAGSNQGTVATAKQQAKNQIQTKIATLTDMVRSPGKMERVEDYLVAKLPYHPQWIRRGTRFDAELLNPLQFGNGQVATGKLRLLGSQPPADSIVHVRLITPLTSADADKGDKVEAILTAPLFSSDRQLILPVGSELSGAVTVARAARWFHRSGQLRFSFREVALPAGLAQEAMKALQTRSTQTVATLNAAESQGNTKLKVDDEGSVTAQESKARFIAPALAALVAMRSADNDEGKAKLEGNGTGNTGGRTLGGGSGFGVFGMIAAQASPTFAGVMGFYGMGWSIYNNVISRGSEVEFGKNAAMDIRFGARPAAPPPASKFTADAGA